MNEYLFIGCMKLQARHAGVPSFAGGGILDFPWGKVAFAEQMTDEEGPYDVLYAADRNDCLSLRGARRPRRAKPRLKRTLIRPCGPPSPLQGEGPERKENCKPSPFQGEGAPVRTLERMRVGRCVEFGFLFCPTPPHPSGLRPSTFPPQGGRWRRSRRMRGRLETGKRSKPISLPAGKRNGFGIQRKRGSRGGQVVPNRVSAARLYAPVEHQPRPQWTTPAEQGNPVVLSHIFSPPGPVGVGTRHRLSHRFPLPSYCGARRPGAPNHFRDAPSSGPAGHLPPARGKVFGGLS